MLRKILLATTLMAMPAMAAETTMMFDQPMVEKATANWPSKVQETIATTIKMYGQPTQGGPEKLLWANEDGQNAKLGPFKSVMIRKQELTHKFPVTHTDFLTHTVAYKVPADKASELTQFDGSVTYDRTVGTLSATCDTLGHNLIALNLAHDIVIGKRSVDDARTMYANLVAMEKKGETSEYFTKLMFTPPSSAADPDMPLSAM